MENLVVSIFLLGLVVQSQYGETSGQAGGRVEVHFINYRDDCSDDFFGVTTCDPSFTFCLTSAHVSSSSVSSCSYGKASTNDHYHDTNNIDLRHHSNIKGIPNPWSVDVSRFPSGGVKLVIRVIDIDVAFDDHLATFGRTFTDRVYPSRSAAPWSGEYTMAKGDVVMKLRIRMYCLENYYGRDCSVHCKQQDERYTCEPGTGRKICKTGWEGPSCDQDINECYLNYCRHGRCVNTPGSYTCQCPEHYHGKNCTIVDDACARHPCQNDGVCQRYYNVYDYICVCRDGWEGKNCAIRSDPCRSAPCRNNGKCQHLNSGEYYHCVCPYPYTGYQCQLFSPTTTTPTTTTATTTTSTIPVTTSTTETTTTPGTTSTSTSITSTVSSNNTNSTSSTIVSTSITTEQKIPPTTPPTSVISSPYFDSARESSNTSSTILLSRTSTAVDNQSYESVNGLPQKEESGSDDELIFLVIPGSAILLFAFILGLVFLHRRRSHSRKKKIPPCPVVPTVSYNNGQVLSFENNVYTRANQNNAEVERNTRHLPTLPTQDNTTTDSIKPFYEELNEGAVGGMDDKAKPSEKSDVSHNHVRAENNPYADFKSLSRQQNPDVEVDNDGLVPLQEESPYDNLDDVVLIMKEESCHDSDVTC